MYDKVKTIRVDGTEWEEANAILESLHMSMSTAVNIFVKQIIIHQGFPIDIALNAESDELKPSYKPEDKAIIGTNANVPVSENLVVDKANADNSVIDMDEHNSYKHYADDPDDNADGYHVGNSSSSSSSMSFDDMFSSMVI